jgi:O-acetyl-ADP-ribose deacetylase (regulator of RNase III)
MIEAAKGNLLLADVEALVNTVNTVGVMGKGIALQFKQAYPDNFDAYQRACRRGEVTPGRMFVFERNVLHGTRWIINFPTKRHWKHKARLADISAGLVDLVRVLKMRNIRSIAVPPLGCGNGGLSWYEVKPLIESALRTLPDVRVLLYAPEGSPDADFMPVNTTRPRLTAARAALLAAMDAYAVPGYRLTLLEVQKLAYFLQIAGVPLQLSFSKGKYGPYAEVINKVLERMEGHFVRGFGDRSRNSTIQVTVNDKAVLLDVLAEEPSTLDRLERVKELTYSFETPHGMELLATVLWAAHDNPMAREEPSSAVAYVRGWSPGKAERFPESHIIAAWDHLRSGGWLSSPAVNSGAANAHA